MMSKYTFTYMPLDRLARRHEWVNILKLKKHKLKSFLIKEV